MLRSQISEPVAVDQLGKPLQVPGPGSQDGRDLTESQASAQEHPGTKGGQGEQDGSSHLRAKAIKILLGPCSLAG